jgi:dolichyl-phosphate beta-glucosyltransferase
MDPIDLSIIVPVYNERGRLENGLTAILAYLDQTPRGELIVVDDGSRDGTGDLAEKIIGDRPNARLIRLPRNRGKGAAVREGMLAARGDVRLFTDVDLSVPIDTANQFAQMCRDGGDIVIGTRKVRRSDVQVHQPRYREMLGEIFRQITLRAFTPGLTDITCGFKAFTAKAAEKIFRPSVIARWSFDAEILFLALRYGLRVTEAPVVWRDNPDTKVRLAIDLPRSVLELITIRLRWMLGAYPRS